MSQLNKILIVEDEYPIALDLESKLNNAGFSDVTIALNYDEAIEVITKNQIDLVFLDINLSEEKTGIDIGKFIYGKHPIALIYLTAYNDEATFLKTADTYPMAFLNKPIVDIDFNKIIRLALNNFKLIQNNLADKKETLTVHKDAVFIKDNGKIVRLKIAEVLHLEALNNYTIVYSIDKKYYLNLFLKDTVELFGEDFYRVHRSHAVALSKIETIENHIIQIGKKEIVISKSYRNDFYQKLNFV